MERRLPVMPEASSELLLRVCLPLVDDGFVGWLANADARDPKVRAAAEKWREEGDWSAFDVGLAWSGMHWTAFDLSRRRDREYHARMLVAAMLALYGMAQRAPLGGHVVVTIGRLARSACALGEGYSQAAAAFLAWYAKSDSSEETLSFTLLAIVLCQIAARVDMDLDAQIDGVDRVFLADLRQEWNWRSLIHDGVLDNTDRPEDVPEMIELGWLDWVICLDHFHHDLDVWKGAAREAMHDVERTPAIERLRGLLRMKEY